MYPVRRKEHRIIAIADRNTAYYMHIKHLEPYQIDNWNVFLDLLHHNFSLSIGDEFSKDPYIATEPSMQEFMKDVTSLFCECRRPCSWCIKRLGGLFKLSVSLWLWENHKVIACETKDRFSDNTMMRAGNLYYSKCRLIRKKDNSSDLETITSEEIAGWFKDNKKED